MCGICGIIHWDGRPVKKEKVITMANALAHRGPDDEGYYMSDPRTPISKVQIGLGFRRLSIIDLVGGHQPMRYKDYLIVFNGEIYNFSKLREECRSHGDQFKTQSDTEVILHLYDRFGYQSFEKLNGMFAFAIWNEKNGEILLARDRFGIKPLYYFSDEKKFVFASEMKSLFCSGEIPLEFDPTGISDFFTYRFVPTPYTVLKGVKKVLPGHFVQVKNGKFLESPYWSPNFLSLKQKETSLEMLSEELLEILEESVRSQMVSDVPLGAFLSGGVDSSLITALMTRNSKEKPLTFSIGFEKGTGVDESFYARRVSKFLGTKHHELILTAKDLVQADQILTTMNEPVADPTVLPTAILSKFARKKVKVVLTGEGGDELFAGYNRYKAILHSQKIKTLYKIFQPIAAKFFRKVGRGNAFKAIPNVTPENWFILNREFGPEELRPIFQNGQFQEEKSYLRSYFESSILSWGENGSNDPVNTILELERSTSLVDRLLMKVDMASMSQSLEARPPYLDHRVVEFAASIPSQYKIRFFKGKYILRKAAEKFLPREICWRRKHGFILPISQWINAHPPEWIDSILENSSLDSITVLNRFAIQKEMEKIRNREKDANVALLWPVIVLSCWLKSLKEGSK